MGRRFFQIESMLGPPVAFPISADQRGRCFAGRPKADVAIGGVGDVQLERVPLAGRFVRLEPYEEAIREGVRQALDCDAQA
jgi:hypothetical protein